MQDLHSDIAGSNSVRDQEDQSIPQPGMPVITHIIIHRTQGMTIPPDQKMLGLVHPQFMMDHPYDADEKIDRQQEQYLSEGCRPDIGFHDVAFHEMLSHGVKGSDS